MKLMPKCPVSDENLERIVDAVDREEPATVDDIVYALIHSIRRRRVYKTLRWLELQGSVIRLGVEAPRGTRGSVRILWGLG